MVYFNFSVRKSKPLTDPLLTAAFFVLRGDVEVEVQIKTRCRHSFYAGDSFHGDQSNEDFVAPDERAKSYSEL